MLQSTEHEIALSELRTELRSLQANPPADDATEEVRAAHDTKITDGLQKLDDLETQKRTALKAEEVAVDRARRMADVEGRVGGGDLPSIPSELREFMGIEARCSVEGFFDGITGNEPSGAEKEMRQSLGIVERGVIPWPMLVEPKRLQEIRQEQRAALAEGGEGAGDYRTGVCREDRRGEQRVPAGRVREWQHAHEHAGPDHPGRVCGLDRGVPDDAVQLGRHRRCARAGVDKHGRGRHGRQDGPRGCWVTGSSDAQAQGDPSHLRHQQD